MKHTDSSEYSYAFLFDLGSVAWCSMKDGNGEYGIELQLLTGTRYNPVLLKDHR